MRGAHYPHHPAFADACDRLGLIFWSEACFWGNLFTSEGVWAAANKGMLTNTASSARACAIESAGGTSQCPPLNAIGLFAVSARKAVGEAGTPRL